VGTACADTVDAELERLIGRHGRREPDPDEREEIWKESVRAYNERRQEEIRAEWHGYFCRLAGTLRARAQEYDLRAAKLSEGEGVNSKWPNVPE
jgi:hypothetical protein